MSRFLVLDRRSLLERALLLAGAATIPSFSGRGLAAAPGRPSTLDADRFSLLSAVADTLVPATDTPGAIDAHVPATFDALLGTWASEQRRAELIDALQAIDRGAREALGTGFAALSSDRRRTFLAAYDEAALQPVSQGTRADLAGPVAARPAVANPGYYTLKDLLVTLYYLSEVALTHELTYALVPGGWTPSIPVSAATRPEGGGLY